MGPATTRAWVHQKFATSLLTLGLTIGGRPRSPDSSLPHYLLVSRSCCSLWPCSYPTPLTGSRRSPAWTASTSHSASASCSNACRTGATGRTARARASWITRLKRLPTRYLHLSAASSAAYSASGPTGSLPRTGPFPRRRGTDSSIIRRQSRHP